jgi:hypothetical protein
MKPVIEVQPKVPEKIFEGCEVSILPNVKLKIGLEEPGSKLLELTLLMTPDAGGGERVLNMRLLTKPQSDFSFGSVFASGILTDTVEFPLEDLKDPRNIFSIFHEMGHITDAAKQYKKDPENIRLALVAADAKKKEGRAYTADELNRLLPFERNAWAEAIRIARGINEEHGVDLFKLFRDKEDFMGWLRAVSLRTYEHDLEKRGLETYTKCGAVLKWVLEESKGSNALTENDKIGIRHWALDIPERFKGWDAPPVV